MNIKSCCFKACLIEDKMAGSYILSITFASEIISHDSSDSLASNLFVTLFSTHLLIFLCFTTYGCFYPYSFVINIIFFNSIKYLEIIVN